MVLRSSEAPAQQWHFCWKLWPNYHLDYHAPMQACSGKGGPSRTRLSPLRLLRQVLVVGALLAATKLLTTAPCGDNGDRAPSVALLTAHPGTINDFNYVAQQLGLDVTISDGYRGIPGLKAYVISREDALGVWSSLGQLYCKHYDAIVISDTVPAGGRPFLEAFTRIPGLPDKCRARRVVMHVTNRFDFGNYGDASFYETVQASLAVDKIRWAQARAARTAAPPTASVSPPQRAPITCACRTTPMKSST